MKMRVEYTENSHNSFMMQALNRQRKNREFCDMAFSVDQNIFYAHLGVLAAVSSHVRNLIASNDTMMDGFVIIIDVRFLSSHVVEELLDYFYTGKILISEKNVEELLKGAEYFSCQKLKSYCSDYLLRSLRKSNVLHYMSLATTYDLKEVEDASYDNMRDNFHYWASPEGTEGMLNCPPPVFSKLLKDDDLHVKNEDQALVALLQWVKHKMPEREKYFKKFFAYLNLTAVSSEALLSARQDMLVFQDHSGPLSSIENVLSDRNHGDPQNLILYQRKGAMVESVVILGGQAEQGKFSRSVFVYIIDENIWLKLTDMPYKAAGLSATSLGKYIYVSGGATEELSGLKTAWKYDVDTDSWIRLPDLPIGLVFHTMVTCGGAVYSIGGSTAPRKYTSSIFKYDEGKEKWVLAGNMSIPMDETAVVTEGDKSIYIVTGRCFVNGQYSRVGVVDCFDVQSRNVVQYITFPIQFNHKPLLSFPQKNVLGIQSHKQSLEIDLKRIQITRSTSPLPLLPNNGSLDISHAVCSVRKNKVFVCGGLICPNNKQPEEYRISQQAYMLDQSIRKWTLLADPPEALDCPGCCTAKMPCKILKIKTVVG